MLYLSDAVLNTGLLPSLQLTDKQLRYLVGYISTNKKPIIIFHRPTKFYEAYLPIFVCRFEFSKQF